LTLNRTKIYSPNAIRNCICILVFGLLLPGFVVWLDPIESAQHVTCSGLRMGMFGLAVLNYQDIHKHFPPAIVRDKDGKPLYGWTAEILPFMEEAPFKKDEPWNGPTNSRLYPEPPDGYICPSVNRAKGDCSSNYMAIIGPGTIWREEGFKTGNELLQGWSRSIIAVEVVDSGKHWAEPFALTVDEILENTRTGKGPRISTCHPNGVHVLFADASVRSFPTKMPLSLWRKILNGEVTYFDDIESQIDPNASDMVDVYVGKRMSIAKVASVLVWLVSAIWLFYRAIKSRRVIPPALGDAG
jgi:prepilin-type processing-associated H-X9-DG protein